MMSAAGKKTDRQIDLPTTVCESGSYILDVGSIIFMLLHFKEQVPVVAVLDVILFAEVTSFVDAGLMLSKHNKNLE
jgi:hypothetical protein